ncbi:TPA: MmcQ/YjbR family DNA-binding protein [Bacillus cytotoxicus]|uniref:MmcQ/YjbR family DNA-binding protein n=1 Tax=Bacillus cytotoxicus TaxID=580165 RepID=UPI00070A1CE6|nr:MmcQ/YjbR family DNA-binding protein [Bacillus cytotoxicus]KRI88999.1 DNA-binding protein [Acinetobacter baumannii]MBN6186998.1 MmcQ/YjbR family DNA-binding protein [Aneurinibacillus sp. BA2021]AWC59307.1 DNA-binding protein [Bacillus cytotoxicus]MBN6192893.1 MmcQ/YjbR family DNA-binding protein [Aneurinibacillus sp. BA2021]HDR7309685.1 MmcQ/YjbR family DNA-binding protein [Bacillus cytotoxicus]
MDKNTIEAICLNLTGTIQDYKKEWEANRFLLGNKMYAMIGEDSEGKPILTLKCDPNRSEELRENYDGITPGYYMNKKHWNSIYFDSNISSELVEKLIIHSYSLVLKNLPKKLQREISQS